MDTNISQSGEYSHDINNRLVAKWNTPSSTEAALREAFNELCGLVSVMLENVPDEECEEEFNRIKSLALPKPLTQENDNAE